MRSLLHRLDPAGIDLKTRIVGLLYQNPFLEPTTAELGLRFGTDRHTLEEALSDLSRVGVLVHGFEDIEDRYRFAPDESVLKETATLADAHLHDEREVRRQVVELESLSRLRDRLAVSQKEVVALLEMSPSGILLLDPFGHLLKCNQQAQQLLDLDDDRHDADICGFLGLELSDVLDHEITLEVEESAGRPPLEVRSRPFRVSGSDTGAMVTVEDISERKALEEEAARLREDFFSMIRHELRRPLLTIQRHLEAPVIDDTEAKPSLAPARTAAGQLASMVDDMLLLARLERDPMAVDATGRLSLRHLLTGSLMACRTGASAKNVRLEIELPDDVTLAGDERRLSQVVGNLVDNAVKFTPSGGSVRLAARGEGSWMVLTVDDSGPGIPEEERLRVLDTFYQVRKDDARSPGLGLGLSICKRVVEAHGGTMEVTESDLGGARIEVRLPSDSCI